MSPIETAEGSMILETKPPAPPAAPPSAAADDFALRTISGTFRLTMNSSPTTATTAAVANSTV